MTLVDFTRFLYDVSQFISVAPFILTLNLLNSWVPAHAALTGIKPAAFHSVATAGI